MAERAVATTKTPETKQKCSNSGKQNVGFNSSGSIADRILQLQRTAGNQAVQRMIKSGALQAKLRVGQPNDIYEQEADRVAEQVMSMPKPEVQRQVKENENEEPIQTKPIAYQITPLVQRQSEDEEGEEIQTKGYAGNNSEVNRDLESRIRSLKGGGQPLPKSVRDFFEPRFGHDFSNVRVHTGVEAAESSRILNARAYTVGNDVVLGAGQYAPETSYGKRLIAHELTHVIQQNPIKSSTKGVEVQKINGFLKLQNSSYDVQLWGLDDHEKLTELAVSEIMSYYSGFKMDKYALETLKDYSTEMDRRFSAICFNLPAILIKSHKKLVKHYKRKKSEAQNHGEGGLYIYNKTDSKRINLVKQEQYENKARKSWLAINREFGSYDECWRTKNVGRREIFSSLGYALHIAQDRGAHGEGAFGEGHSRPNFKPDDPSINKEGWKEAFRNSQLVILRASDILYKLLDKKWSRTCSYTRIHEPSSKK